jgi:predicted nucleic acid-binding protein
MSAPAQSTALTGQRLVDGLHSLVGHAKQRLWIASHMWVPGKTVLSEPTKPAPDPRVVSWLRAHEPDIAVDPVILGELRFGILILPRGRKRASLESWFNAGVGRLHCIPWEADTGLKWAELLARLHTMGKAMPIKDSLIAATAVVHGLAVATRNRVDFVNAGVRTVDPFVG